MISNLPSSLSWNQMCLDRVSSLKLVPRCSHFQSQTETDSALETTRASVHWSLPHLRTRAHGIIYVQTRRFSQWIMNIRDKQTLIVIVSNEWITVHHRAITFECENFRSLDLLESVSTWERTEELIGIFGQMFAFLPFEANHLLVINDDISDVRSWSFCEIQSAYVCCLLSKWWHKVVFRKAVALNIWPSDLHSVQKQWRIQDCFYYRATILIYVQVCPVWISLATRWF